LYPANGAILAPNARCLWVKGVFKISLIDLNYLHEDKQKRAKRNTPSDTERAFHQKSKKSGGD
jgi:hypothetical protein